MNQTNNLTIEQKIELMKAVLILAENNSGGGMGCLTASSVKELYVTCLQALQE